MHMFGCYYYTLSGSFLDGVPLGYYWCYQGNWGVWFKFNHMIVT